MRDPAIPETPSAVIYLSADTAAMSPTPTPPHDMAAKPSKRDQKPCPQCGKMFGRTIYNGITQSPSGFARRIYCSHRCRADSQIKIKEGAPTLSSFVFQKRCPNCNKLFGLRLDSKGKQQTPSSFKKKRFCSIICGAVAHATAKRAKLDEASV